HPRDLLTGPVGGSHPAPQPICASVEEGLRPGSMPRAFAAFGPAKARAVFGAAPTRHARRIRSTPIARPRGLPPAGGAGRSTSDAPPRAVVDAERARNNRVDGDAEPAQDLHAAVDDAPDRLRTSDLGHA